MTGRRPFVYARRKNVIVQVSRNALAAWVAGALLLAAPAFGQSAPTSSTGAPSTRPPSPKSGGRVPSLPIPVPSAATQSLPPKPKVQVKVILGDTTLPVAGAEVWADAAKRGVTSSQGELNGLQVRQGSTVMALLAGVQESLQDYGPATTGDLTPVVSLTLPRTDRAKARFDTGNELYKLARRLDPGTELRKQPLNEAEREYEIAWGLHKSFDLAANMGALELEPDLGLYCEATEHLAWAVDNFPLSRKTEELEGIKKNLTTARARGSRLRVYTKENGERIWVDDLPLGVSTRAGDVFEKCFNVGGRHVVVARTERYESVPFSVDVPEGSSMDVDVGLESKKRPSAPAIVMGSLGGAAAVTGVVMIGLAESKHSDAVTLSAQTHHACPVHASAPQGLCAQLASAATLGDTLGNGGIVALVVAGAAAVGVGTYLLWPPALELRVHVKPNVSMNGGSVMLYGDF
jgi:hypothetical protein